jgi:hypothetical protein
MMAVLGCPEEFFKSLDNRTARAKEGVQFPAGPGENQCPKCTVRRVQVSAIIPGSQVSFWQWSCKEDQSEACLSPLLTFDLTSTFQFAKEAIVRNRRPADNDLSPGRKAGKPVQPWWRCICKCGFPCAEGFGSVLLEG